MTFGVMCGQAVSYKVLTRPPLGPGYGRYAAILTAITVFCFSTFTFFPPHVRLFENFYCYEYTGDFGFLPDYEPYRVFLKKDDPRAKPGGGVQYCKAVYERRRATEVVAASGEAGQDHRQCRREQGGIRAPEPQVPKKLDRASYPT